MRTLKAKVHSKLILKTILTFDIKITLNFSVQEENRQTTPLSSLRLSPFRLNLCVCVCVNIEATNPLYCFVPYFLLHGLKINSIYSTYLTHVVYGIFHIFRDKKKNILHLIQLPS